MKLFVFLTVIAFASASPTEEFHDTANELHTLQLETFGTVVSEIHAGINNIVGILGDSKSTDDLRTICESGVPLAISIMKILEDAIITKGDGNVKDEACKAIDSFKTMLVNQFGKFEARAVEGVTSDQESEIHDLIQGISRKCSKNLEPLFQRIAQLA